MGNTAAVTGSKPSADRSQSISCVNAVNSLVTFYDVIEERERCYSFVLSQKPQETRGNRILIMLIISSRSLSQSVRLETSNQSEEEAVLTQESTEDIQTTQELIPEISQRVTRKRKRHCD
jgi:hypothetical protein